MSKKILLVDDEANILDLLGRMLERNGYDVITALSGDECLKKADTQKPDLIILDILMPQVDGFQTCRNLKQNQNTKDIPVIMLTALVNEEDLTKGLNEGARCFISKPFSIGDVLGEIKSVLGLSHGQKS